MTTQRQIDIEFDSLTRENDSPKLIANSKATGGTLLSVIKEQLSACGSFDFCVAFVADGGLQILVETFQELKQRGIKGRLLTSTYLNFNSPDVFRKLLEYDNMEVRVFQGNLHAKGYIFDKGETSTVIVGSSNMTQTALTCNKEWNVLYQTVENSRLLGELRSEFNSLWNDTSTVLLSQDWIENYAAYRSARPSKPKSKPPFQAAVCPTTNDLEEIKPNKMQQRALEALGVIHRKGETRALLVSATGTGKTFLSAFDVLATKPRRVLFLAHRRRIIDASRASYERLLGSTYTFDTYQTGKNISNATCVFAMCSSVAKHLSDFRPDEFDYIVIDEAHRTGSQGYQSIMSHFTPRFYLGMTATPNRTDSAIIFIQQLGRGLRLNDGKEYALVLDFIGNYQSNFLVPIALSGDKTYNKDRLRRLVQEGDSAIPGCSTVSFDRISEARIYKAIDGGDFTSVRFLKNEYLDLRQKLGKIPSLLEFDRNGSIDPLLIFKNSGLGSYHAFLSKYEPDYTVHFSSDQTKILKFISQKLAAGKRFEDLYLLQTLVEAGHEGYRHMREAALRNYRAQLKDSAVRSAIAVLKGDFATPKDFVSLLIDDGCGPRLTEVFATALRNAEFKRQILEVLDFGIERNRLDYAETYENTNFVLNAKYTYEEVCRLMNWQKNINGQNLGGYFYDEKTNTFPVFINYDKAPDISESIQHEDRFVSPSKLIAISKGNRTLNSPEILRLQAWPENGLKTYLFMRKNKDDKGGKEFYFLGEMHPTGEFEAIKTKSNDNAVEIEYELNTPVRQDIYEFMLSDLSEAE